MPEDQRQTPSAAALVPVVQVPAVVLAQGRVSAGVLAPGLVSAVVLVLVPEGSAQVSAQVLAAASAVSA